MLNGSKVSLFEHIKYIWNLQRGVICFHSLEQLVYSIYAWCELWEKNKVSVVNHLGGEMMFHENDVDEI